MFKNTLVRLLWPSLTVVWAVVAFGLAPAPAAAATMTIPNGLVAIANDGQCSLLEAVENANSDAAVYADCPAGSGTDTIELAVSGNYQLITPTNYTYGPAGFEVRSHIIIQGQGATIGRGGSTPLRLIYVAPLSQLELFDLVLQNGYAQGGDGGISYWASGGGAGGLGGAIFNRGLLTIQRSSLVGNTAEGGDSFSGINFTGTGGGGGGLGGHGGHIDNNNISIPEYGGGGGGGNSAAGGNGLDVPPTAGAGGSATGGNGGLYASGDNASGVGGGGGGGGTSADGTIGYNGGQGGFGGGGGGGGRGSNSYGNGGDGGFAGGGGGRGAGITGGLGGFGAGDGYNTGGGGAALGGAIFNDASGYLILINSTLTNNRALAGSGGEGGSAYGAAVFSRDGNVTIQASTIYSNAVEGGYSDFTSPGSFGGAVYVYNDLNEAHVPVLLLEYSIIAQTFGRSTDLGSWGLTTACDHSTGITIGGGSNALNREGSCNVLSPQIVLADNEPNLVGSFGYYGGATPVYPLLSLSPALDVFAGCPFWLTIDQRGVARPVNSSCDIGAYEAIANQLCTGIGDGTTFSAVGTTIYLNTAGDINCLYVEAVPQSHPQASAGLQTGNYWRIQALNSSGNPAAGYTAELTLPHPNLTNPSVCKWVNGPGSGWDCAVTSSTSATATRHNITSFSDWAVGTEVGPTAVQLQAVTAGSSSWLWLGLGLLLPLLLLSIWFLNSHLSQLKTK